MDSFNLAIYGIENASIPSQTTTESWLPASDLSSLQFVHTCVCEYVASFFFFSLSHIEALSFMPQPHLTFITTERESMHINWSFVGNGFSFRFSVYHFVGMSLLSSLWFFLRNHIGLGSSHNASPFSSSSPTFCYGIFALSAFPSLARTLLHIPNPNYFNGCLRSSLSL